MQVGGTKQRKHIRQIGVPIQHRHADKPAPLRRSGVQLAQPRVRARASSEQVAALGSHNANPHGIGLLALIAEDFRAHNRSLLEPGFLAIALHRFGNARMGVRPRLLRAPLTLAYRAAFVGINWLWGIDLAYTVKLGRRVRIWHHGCIVLNARSIGDDVHIRHNTTLGVARRTQDDDKPTIGNRVDIGVGVCILGDITVGDDCVIGANAVVLNDLPSLSTAVGVPAHTVHPESAAQRALRYQRHLLPS